LVTYRLTPEETNYYRFLFLLDKENFTILDVLDELSAFRDRFKNAGEKLAFVEFLSNIFHIRWEHDVFARNHQRLIDILFGIQHAIDQGDVEAKQVVDDLYQRFYQIVREKGEQIRQRVFAATKKLMAAHRERIPNKDRIHHEVVDWLKLSQEYVVNSLDSIIRDRYPEWIVSQRIGISLDNLTYEALNYDPEKRETLLFK